MVDVCTPAGTDDGDVQCGKRHILVQGLAWIGRPIGQVTQGCTQGVHSTDPTATLVDFADHCSDDPRQLGVGHGMEIRYEKIRVETTANGINLIVPRRVGKDILLALEGATGPTLVADMLKALEPHFPTNEGTSQPMSVMMTIQGFAWQGGVSETKDEKVFLTIRPPQAPGLHFVMPPEQAMALGKALIDLATAATAPKTTN